MLSMSELARSAWRRVPAWARPPLRHLAGDSGERSRGRSTESELLALNDFVQQNAVHSVVELGCGEGEHLSNVKFANYLGLDASPAAVQLCRARFAPDATKKFAVHDPRWDAARLSVAEVALSWNAVQRFVDGDAFEPHLRHLFAAATKWVIVHASSLEVASEGGAPRGSFTAWIQKHQRGWTLERVVQTAESSRDTDGAVFLVFGRG